MAAGAIAAGLLLLCGVAVLTVAVMVGGAEVTEIHIDRLSLEGTTRAFFFMGAGATLATCVGVGCLAVGFARRRSSRSGSDAYPDDRGVHPNDRAAYPDDRAAHPDDRGAHPDDRGAHPDDGEVGRVGDRPDRPRSQWTEYGANTPTRRPRRTVPRND